MGHWHSDGTYHSEAAATDQGAPMSRLKWVLGITLGFMAVELLAGWWTNSLALTADATHMLTDAAALGLALISLAIGRKSSSATHSYGYYRAEILGAFANGVFLVLLALGIIWGALQRLQHPEPVEAGPMILVAGLGLVVNLTAGFLLAKDSHNNLALRGALLHVLGDALGSVGAIAAGVAIWWKGWLLADPLVSIGVALLILATSSGFLRETTHVILQGVPRSHDLRQIDRELRALAGVADLHDLHLWSLTPAKLVLTVHVVEAPELTVGSDALLKQIKDLLRDKFGISHSTIQMEKSDLKDGCSEAFRSLQS